MMIPQRIMLNDRVWDIERHHSFKESTHVPVSHVLVCPACTRIWAMLQLPEDRFCWPRAVFCGCISHTDEWHPVPGSLLVEEGWGVIDDSLLNALPPELVKREFDLHLKVYSL